MSEQEKPLTFKQFIEFYRSEIEPRLKKIDLIDQKLETYQNISQSRFDDLYKKFEDLHTEYKVITQQFKEIEQGLDVLRALPLTLIELKNQIADLYRRVEELEKQLTAH